MSDDDALGNGALGTAILERLNIEKSSLTPQLPKKIAIEINNSCNHECFFCPNPIMSRPRRVMAPEAVKRILQDARSQGIEEVSFYSTGEPFLHKGLPDLVSTAKDIGFRYVFLSTNGGKVVTKRLEPVLAAGLDSLKFSINAGNKETYALVHGHDEFDDVIANVEFVSKWRSENRHVRLFVSFVETEHSAETFNELKSRVAGLVDEVVRYPFVVIGTPLEKRSANSSRPYVGYEQVNKGSELNKARTTLPCYQLWSYINVTVEGLLTACCSDFNNDLVVGNLNTTSLVDAWNSDEFQDLRQRHLQGDVRGTLCAGCIRQAKMPYRPINNHLISK